MPTINQEDLFSRFIPDVFIQKITLENSGFFPAEINPHIDNEREREYSTSVNDCMRITINLVVKEVFDDDVIGKWISNIDLKKYLKIKIFQVTKPEITSLLGISKDFITLVDPELYGQTKSSVKRIAYSYLGATSEERLKQILNRDVKLRHLDLLDSGQDSNPLRNVQIKKETNDDGTENYNISYNVRFDLKTSDPKHLAYFFMSVFDIQKLSQEYNLQYPLLSALETTRISSEIVINQGQASTETYAYLLENGDIWTGEQHRLANGTYRTGAQETADSVNLVRIRVPNSKLQDFRNIKEINKLQFDFRRVNQYFQKLKNVNSSPPKPRDTKNLFGNIQLTRDIDRNSNFIFDINFKDMVIANSMFSEMIRSYDSRIADELVSNAQIKFLRIFRRRVKETFSQTNRFTDQAGYVPFQEDEIEETIISLAQLQGADSLSEIDQEEVYLRENLGIAFPDIRTIECTDRSMTYVTDGIYQYGVELEVSDPTYPFLEQKLSNLRKVKDQAEKYLQEASKLSISKYFLEVADPHIKSRSEKDLLFTQLEGNYDPLTNSFTKTFIKKMKQVHQNARLAPWVLVPSVYADVLELFVEDLDSVFLAKELMKMMSPISGNPSGIIATIKLLDTLIFTLSSVLGIVENTDSLGKKTSASVTKTYKLKHYFNNDVFDSDYDDIIAYEFFDETIVPEARRREITINKKDKPKKRIGRNRYTPPERIRPAVNTRSGLLKIDGQSFRKMVNNETLKFFNSSAPNIRNPINTSIKDSIQNTNFSFFTPSKISTFNKDYSLSSPKAKVNSKLEKDICDKDTETKRDIVINNIRNIGIAAANNTETIICTENFETLENNLRALTKAISKEASVIIELTTIDKEDLPEPAPRRRPTTTFINDAIADRLGDRRRGRGNRVSSRANILDSITSIKNGGFLSFINSIGKDIDSNRRGSTTKTKNVPSFPTNKDSMKTTNFASRISPQKISKNIQSFVSDKEMLRMPNQLKATLLNNLGKSSVKTTQFAPSKANPVEVESRHQVNLASIKQMQVLSGYERGENGKMLVNKPIWKNLDQTKYNALPNDRGIVARLVEYDNKKLCNPKPGSIRDIKVLNDKFILRPDTTVRTPPKKNDFGIKLPNGSLNVSKGILDEVAKDSTRQSAISPIATKTSVVSNLKIEDVVRDPKITTAVQNIETSKLATNLNNLTTQAVTPPPPPPITKPPLTASTVAAKTRSPVKTPTVSTVKKTIKKLTR